MKKISIKIANESMPCLISYLFTCEKWATSKRASRSDQAIGAVLYDLRVKLATKYAKYKTKPSFSMQLTLAESASFCVFFVSEPLPNNPLSKHIIRSVFQAIDQKL